MANRDLVEETDSSWICGRATMNMLPPCCGGSSTPAPRRVASPASDHAGVRHRVGPVPRRVLDATTLLRTHAVVRHRRHVLDPGDLEPRRGERADRGLAARARTLDEHVDLLQPVLLRLAC